jgi:hypothetical protein
VSSTREELLAYIDELEVRLQQYEKEEVPRGSIVPGSLAAEFSPVLKEWLGAKAPLTQLWKSSNVQDVAGFHQACDGKGNTLVLVRWKEGNVFGGFAVPAWASSGGYTKDARQLSFVFVLKNTFGDPPTRFKLTSPDHEIYCDSARGPSFGGGHDLCLWDGSQTYSALGSYYANTLGRGGSTFASSGRNFEVDTYEVWAAAGPPTFCP